MKTLWLLIKLRFLSLFLGNKRNKAKKRHSIPLTILLGLAVLYIVAVFVGLFLLVFGATAPFFLSQGEPFAYFALMGLVATVFMLFGSIIFTQSQLFEAGDNAFLLSLPIPPHLILGSRMLFLLLLNYAMQAIVFIPGFIVWLLVAPLSFGSIALCFLSFLALPFPVLAISCLLGWCLTKIVQRIRYKQLISILFAAVFFVAYFWLIGRAEILINGFIEAGIEPIVSFLKKAFPFAVFGRAALGSFIHFLLVFAASALLFGGVYAWLSKTFFKTVLSPTVHRKRAYKEKNAKKTSALWAFTKKEFFYLASSSGYILNGCISLLFVLIVPIAMLFERDIFLSLPAEMAFIGELLPILSPLVTCLISSMMMLSCSSVSLEGKSLWIARTSPVPTKTILYSKLLLQIIPTGSTAFLAWVIYLFALPTSFPVAILSLILPLVFTVCASLLGLTVNLLFPKLEWNNILVPIKQGASSLFSILASGVLSFILLVGGFLLSFVLPPLLVLSILTLIPLLLSLLLFAWIRGRGARRFEALV